jgi:hypothetical protein
LPTGSTHAIKFYDLNRTPANKPSKDIFGNHSRYAQNWISGPTHNIVRQHVPGYTGHVPGIISESIISKSYAKCTATAIGKRHPKGFDVVPKVRYLSQHKLEYNPKAFRRIGM